MGAFVIVTACAKLLRTAKLKNGGAPPRVKLISALSLFGTAAVLGVYSGAALRPAEQWYDRPDPLIYVVWACVGAYVVIGGVLLLLVLRRRSLPICRATPKTIPRSA